ncbi:hypothetical protein [Mucilaginibacter phyllosphaerae]|uniref:Type II toxin-antitoxin system antitoxin, RelB/DinJ family n=1 Tax=Mucilaginibacter phyllosphaerae TaxID=1812349 RepID=A0A4Y8A9A6_9SPHI|nr:hypothetical protein [Mucilaginibacter phyllosphaerae]MBB3970481.1 hypothetical protein [Mucilaginibacter phyllosphaerae]TEW64497.1 hypothetical protein E2R65_15855 [Mucilaginibacter phyllosphaerae]GGH19048.1 hypothetical protein GCM10007352_30170 [Mucilaginibacter phyllosphaerae]
MLTLEIQVPDNKTNQVKQFLKELQIPVKVKKQKNIPNADTLKAMNELKAGNGEKFGTVEELFDSIK